MWSLRFLRHQQARVDLEHKVGSSTVPLAQQGSAPFSLSKRICKAERKRELATKIEKDRNDFVQRLYRDEHMSFKQIGQRLKISRYLVKKQLHQMGRCTGASRSRPKRKVRFGRF